MEHTKTYTHCTQKLPAIPSEIRHSTCLKNSHSNLHSFFIYNTKQRKSCGIHLVDISAPTDRHIFLVGNSRHALLAEDTFPLKRRLRNGGLFAPPPCTAVASCCLVQPHRCDPSPTLRFPRPLGHPMPCGWVGRSMRSSLLRVNGASPRTAQRSFTGLHGQKHIKDKPRTAMHLAPTHNPPSQAVSPPSTHTKAS